MNDDVKAKQESEKEKSELNKEKRELMTKILSWGTIVYFLVLGYSINQSSSFELNPASEFGNIANAKRFQANVIRKQNNQNIALANSNSDPEIVKAGEIVKAAELDLEAKKIDEEGRDGNRRAWGLILASAVFSIFYFFLIYMFYQRYEKDMTGYAVPKRAALIYAAFIGVSILVTAIMTAYF